VVVLFADPDANGNFVFARLVSTSRLFTLKDLGIPRAGNATTAGNDWYQQSLGVFAVWKEENGAIQSVFCLRLRDGTEVLLDRRTTTVMPSVSETGRSEIRRLQASEAQSLLKSSNSWDRLTGAIHCGTLGVTDALPTLNGLTRDEAAYTALNGTNVKKVYYVQEAARAAILRLSKQTQLQGKGG